MCSTNSCNWLASRVIGGLGLSLVVGITTGLEARLEVGPSPIASPSPPCHTSLAALQAEADVSSTAGSHKPKIVDADRGAKNNSSGSASVGASEQGRADGD